jgi:hypothetical protein
VKQLLINAIASINPAVIAAAPRVSWKMSRVPGLSELVPQEAVYHTELFAVLHSWLTVDVSVISETNVKRSDSPTQYCDLALKYPYNTTLLELVATAPLDKIQEHIDRTEHFQKVLRAQEAWVINFTLQKPTRHYEYTQLTSEHVNLLHVWHNETFTEVEYWSSEEGKFIPILR